jgi:hypothetical protein
VGVPDAPRLLAEHVLRVAAATSVPLRLTPAAQLPVGTP